MYFYFRLIANFNSGRIKKKKKKKQMIQIMNKKKYTNWYLRKKNPQKRKDYKTYVLSENNQRIS